MNYQITGKPSTDRRAAPRVRVFAAGLLASPDGTKISDCLIRDLGTGGLQIRLGTNHPIPDGTFLIDLKNGQVYESRMLWRMKSLVGLSFRETFVVRGTLPENMRFLLQLYEEGSKRLYRRVEDLWPAGPEVQY